MDVKYCSSCGASTKDLPSGIDVFGIIAYSTGLIVSFGFVGGVIGLAIAFASLTMDSAFASSGLIGLLLIMMFVGIGAVVGAAIGIVGSIIIGLKSTPKKTKGAYFKIIGIPIIIVLIIVLWIFTPISIPNNPIFLA